MKAKRFLSVLVAVLMLVSCFAIVVSAAEKDPIINTTKEVTLTITLYDTETNRADNADNFNTEIITDGTDVAGTEQTVTGFNGIVGSKFELRLQNADGETYPEAATAYGTTNENGVLTFKYTGDNDDAANTATKLAQGRYKVTNSEKAAAQVAKVLEFYVDLPMTNPAGDDWMYNVYVYPKIPTDTSKPQVEKSVSNDGVTFGHDATIHSIDDSAATWKITSKLPEGIENYHTFKFTDIVDPRLIVVENEGAKVTTVSYDGTALTNGTDYTVKWSKVMVGDIEVYDKLEVEFTVAGIKKLAADKTITITYQTKIDITIDSAVATFIGNHVVLDYENNAGLDGTVDNTPHNTTDDSIDPDDPTTYPGKEIEIPDPEDPDQTITVKEPSTPGDNTDGKEDKDPFIYTGKIDAVKIEKGKTDVKLKGVEFALLDASKNHVKDNDGKDVTAITDDNGLFSFVGLKTGKYYLRETKTIKGYELIGEDIEFEITKTNLDYTDDEKGILYNNGNTNYIENIPSTKLPLTGGMGVGMFALIGFAFAAVGGAFFFKSKKVSE